MAAVYSLYLPQVIQLSTAAGAPLMNHPINRTNIHVFGNCNNKVLILLKDIDRRPYSIPSGSVPVIHVFDTETKEIVFEESLTLVDASQGLWSFHLTSADLPNWKIDYQYAVYARAANGLLTPFYTDRNYTPYGVLTAFPGPKRRLMDPIEIMGASLTPSGGKLVSSGYPGSLAMANPSGQHTATFYLENFTGSVMVQGSLDPTAPTHDGDWANIAYREFSDRTGTVGLPFTGDLNWVRFVIDTNAGTVEKIAYLV